MAKNLILISDFKTATKITNLNLKFFIFKSTSFFIIFDQTQTDYKSIKN